MDPEYYVGAWKQADGSWKTSKYTDGSAASFSPEAQTVIWERKPLYFSAIPGLSGWAKSKASTQPLPGSNAQSASKYPRILVERTAASALGNIKHILSTK